MTPLEERSGYGAEARPANVGDDREAFYARSVRDLDSLIKAEACFRKRRAVWCGCSSESLYCLSEAPRGLARFVT